MEKKNEQMAKPCCSWRSTKENNRWGIKETKKKLKPAHQLVCPCLFSGTHAQGTKAGMPQAAAVHRGTAAHCTPHSRTQQALVPPRPLNQHWHGGKL